MKNKIPEKIRVLIFVGHYLPGYKSGGILRSIENTVNNLHVDFDFFIVTRDHDLGEDNAYENVKIGEWQAQGNSFVKYLDSNGTSFLNICNILKETPYNTIYLNSFFDPLSIKVLLACKLGIIHGSSIILSPRGEFAWASLKIKYIKKLSYILLSKAIRLYNNIIWHVSSEYEAEDLIEVMNVEPSTIRIAKDLPVNIQASLINNNDVSVSQSDQLRLIFLSRISPEKNLYLAINILSKVQCDIIFDIYGTIENASYWEKCQELIESLPVNVIVKYCGPVKPNMVISTFLMYDLFFFPSGGENYGHVIVESLSAGTSVLISKNTPWRDLQEKGLGWDVDLANISLFVEIIEKFAMKDKSELKSIRKQILSSIGKLLMNDEDLQANRNLFLENSY